LQEKSKGKLVFIFLWGSLTTVEENLPVKKFRTTMQVCVHCIHWFISSIILYTSFFDFGPAAVRRRIQVQGGHSLRISRKAGIHSRVRPGHCNSPSP